MVRSDYEFPNANCRHRVRAWYMMNNALSVYLHPYPLCKDMKTYRPAGVSTFKPVHGDSSGSGESFGSGDAVLKLGFSPKRCRLIVSDYFFTQFVYIQLEVGQNFLYLFNFLFFKNFLWESPSHSCRITDSDDRSTIL